jgi:hypothetical protein
MIERKMMMRKNEVKTIRMPTLVCLCVSSPLAAVLVLSSYVGHHAHEFHVSGISFLLPRPWEACLTGELRVEALVSA